MSASNHVQAKLKLNQIDPSCYFTEHYIVSLLHEKQIPVQAKAEKNKLKQTRSQSKNHASLTDRQARKHKTSTEITQRTPLQVKYNSFQTTIKLQCHFYLNFYMINHQKC